MFAVHSPSPTTTTVGCGAQQGATAAPAVTKGRRRSRRSSRPKFVHVLHPGHDGRVAFVIPSADVTSLGVAPVMGGGSSATASANATPEGTATGVDGAPSTLSPLPTLCPSCLPVFDPLSTDGCPHAAGKQTDPFPTSSAAGGGAAAAAACGLVHAALDCATRHEVHRRTDGLLGLGARYQEDAGGDRSSKTLGGAGEPAGAGASVLVGMPNLPTEREPVRPSTCLVTQADLNPHKAVPPFADGGGDAAADTNTPPDPTAGGSPDDAPRHCVHWLQRGICIYGSSCRFVHCLEPSARCLAVLRSAVSEQQQKQRRASYDDEAAADDSPAGVIERVPSETPSLTSPGMMGATATKPFRIGVQDPGDQQRQQACALPPGGIRIPAGVATAPSPAQLAQPVNNRGARRGPNPATGSPAQAVSDLLPQSALLLSTAGITNANGTPPMQPPPQQPVQYVYQQQPPAGPAFYAGPQLFDPAQAPQFYQHHYPQHPQPLSAPVHAQHQQYPQVVYTNGHQQPPQQQHHAFLPMQGAHGIPLQLEPSPPQLWQQQQLLQPQQSHAPHHHHHHHQPQPVRPRLAP